MVVSSRPSLRSSSRLAEIPATVPNKPRDSAQHTNRAKRRRTPSDYEDQVFSAKKQKPQIDKNKNFQHLPRNKLSTSAGSAVHRGPATRHEQLPRSSRSANESLKNVSQSQRPAQPNDSVKQDGDKSTKALQKSETRDEKRSLRSQGASRFKSDLALYFPSYDEMISNEPREPEVLTADTKLVIIDDGPESSDPNLRISVEATRQSGDHTQNHPSANSHDISAASDGTTSKPTFSQKIDFSSIEKHTRHTAEDPLTDDLYFKAHRRAERQEKQLRNIERERAQHEKQHLERLLEGLWGPDWLKVMGITGITESEKKLYEPKRNLFIEEVGALVAKFKAWKEEEKRRKVKRGQVPSIGEQHNAKDKSPGSGLEHQSNEQTPDSSDVDAWAARQLHQEAISASGATHTEPAGPKKKEMGDAKKPVHPEKPFTSFYSKPYLRAAALGKHRRRRTQTAFGQPLPEMTEKDFKLPEHILTQEAKTSRARSRRRLVREAKGS